jgi:murein L,D-transpeptidase YafK
MNRAATAILLAASLSTAALADDAAPAGTLTAIANNVEASLVRAIVGLSENGLRQSLGEIDGVLSRTPNFRLGHLIKGDLLMARSGNPVAFAPVQVASRASVLPLQEEARARLQRFVDAPPAGHLPVPVLHLSSNQPNAILVDTGRSRLYVFANENGAPRLVADFYVSVGKKGSDKLREGDQKTPLGVYTIVSAKNKVSDLYGSGAFPISYPNEWDRMQGRNGHGIWLHGTPSDTYSRAPRATDGCVALTNDDLARLSRYVSVGRTPVVISDEVEWAEPDRWEASRREFLAAFEQWRTDWESLDTSRYLSHYAPVFRSQHKGYDAWVARKRQVNAGKSWIKVGVSDLSVLGRPGAEETVVVTFAQDYRSSNLSNRTVKRQYWSREKGSWRIVFETVV